MESASPAPLEEGKSPENSKPAAPSSRLSFFKKHRRLIIAGLCLVVIVGLFAIVLLGPTIASTSLGRSIILSKVNAYLNGEVTVDDWSLGWFTGTKVHGLRIKQEGAQILEMKSLVSEITVWRLLRGNFALGQTKVDGLDFVLKQYADGTNNFQKLVKNPQPSEEPLVVPDLNGEVDVDFRGTIEQQMGGATRAVFVERGHVKAKVTDINGPLQQQLELAIRVGGGSPGAITAAGIVKVFEKNRINLSSFKTDMTLDIKSVDAASLLPFIAPEGQITRLEGIVNAKLALQVAGPDEMTMEGNGVIKPLIVSGPILKDDTFQTSELTLAIPKTVITQSTRRIRVGQVNGNNQIAMKFDQGLISIQADAPTQAMTNLAAGKKPGADGSFFAKFELNDIGKLASQMPNVFNLAPGVAIQKGRVAAEASLQLAADKAIFKARGDLSDLEGTNQGKHVVAQPVHFEASATNLGGPGVLPELRDITVALTSSFAKLSGGGASLEKLNLQGDLNLALMQKELGQFVNFSGNELQGQANLNLNVTELTASGQTFELAMTGKDIVIGKPQNPMRFANPNFNAAVQMSKANAAAPIRVTKLDGNIGLARIALVEPIVATKSAAGWGASGAIKVDGSIRDASDFWLAMQGLSKEQAGQFAGDYTLTQKFKSDGAGMSIVGQATVANLTLGDTKGQSFTERALVVNNDIATSAKDNVLVIKNVSIDAQSSKALKAILTGQVVDLARKRRFDNLSLKLSYNAAEMLKAIRPLLSEDLRKQIETLKVEGIVADRVFAISGSYPVDRDPKKGKQSGEFVRMNGSIRIDRAEYDAMAMEKPLDLPFSLADGKLAIIDITKPKDQQLPPTIPLSGGKLDLGGLEIELFGANKHIHSPRKNYKLLDRVNASRQFLAHYFGSTHPLFSDLLEVRAVVDVTIEELNNLPIGEHLFKAHKAEKGSASIAFAISDMNIRGGLMDILASQLSLRTGPNGSIGAIRNGKIRVQSGSAESNMDLDIAGKSIGFREGDVRLSDGRIISMKMLVPKELIPFARDQKFVKPIIEVPISGSVTKPGVDIVKAAGSSLSPENALDLLNGLKKLKKDGK